MTRFTNLHIDFGSELTGNGLLCPCVIQMLISPPFLSFSAHL